MLRLLLSTDGDHDVAPDDAKCGDESAESLKLVEVVDELKPEAEEHQEGEEAKAAGDKDDVHVEEGDVKNEDGELSVDVHRESKYSACIHDINFTLESFLIVTFASYLMYIYLMGKNYYTSQF